jgi:acyl transferase domain-containing protein
MESLPADPGGAPPPVGSLLDAFDRATLKIAIAPPRIAFASSVSGQILGSDAVEIRYWRRQNRASFRFSEAIFRFAPARHPSFSCRWSGIGGSCHSV